MTLFLFSLVGHAHTFSSAIERAKEAEGDLVLRIEDIDIQRCKPQYLDDMIEDMEWFQLWWNKGYGRNDKPFDIEKENIDENDDDKEIKKRKFLNPNDEYIQSKRFHIYERAWKILYDRGYLYPCPLSRKDVDQALSAPHDNITPINPPINLSSSNEKTNSVMIGEEIVFPPRLRPSYLDNPDSLPPPLCFPEKYQGLTTPIGSKINWRFRIPPKEWKNEIKVEEDQNEIDDYLLIKFTDVLCGEQNFYGGYHFGDFVIWRADGIPSYELAVTVDDILMGVSITYIYIYYFHSFYYYFIYFFLLIIGYRSRSRS